MDADRISIESEPKCRICSCTNENDQIINPCNCAGTVGLVHRRCLERWISVSCKTHCELCTSKYRGRKKLKYGVCSSVPFFLWAHKADCGILYCYLKMWIYLYILSCLIREYRVDSRRLPSSIAFLIFLTVSFTIGITLMTYNLVTCMITWHKWRMCQFKFIPTVDEI